MVFAIARIFFRISFFNSVVVKLFGRVGEVDVGEHLRHLLTLELQCCVYFRGLVLVVNVVPEVESDAN